MAILIVDDQEQNLYLLESLLKGNGFNTEKAENGREALEILEKNEIELIVTDILMPVMDGFELCQQIKTNEKLCSIPLIFYTATYTGQKDEEFALKIGAEKFLEKPCEPDILLGHIKDTLASSQAKRISKPELPPESEVLKLYNERLIRKLENKMLELENETRRLRETQGSLKASESKYHRLLQGMTNGFVYCNLQGEIEETNQAYCDMLGYDAQELKQINYLELTPEKWHEMEKNLFARIRQEEATVNIEKEYIRKDGSIFPVEVRLTIAHDEQGRQAGLWAIVRDMTEAIKARKKHKELQSQLFQSQKMETVGRLAGGVAHDFNNMLSVIIGYSNLILESIDKDDRFFEELNEIYQSGLRAQKLTRQLLTFSRKQEIHAAVLDLNELVKSFEKLMKRLIGDNISLQLNLATEPLWVKADASQLEQILMNLAINASDSMPEGGSLCIETTTVSPQTHLRNLAPELSKQPAAVLTFTDTGSGMSRETIKQVFEPFFTTKSKDKGTGLGLSTCYGIVKQHNGLILVDSEPGKGSVFKVLLPLSAKCGSETPPVINEEISISRTAEVLVMEDDPHVRKLICMILQNKGFNVTAVENGQQGIEVSRTAKKPFALIIADVIMPVVNGPKACKEIVKIFPEARILFISGYADNKLEEYGISRAQINFLHKPFTRNELIKTISLMLDNKDKILSKVS